jgi:hypothetical protein
VRIHLGRTVLAAVVSLSAVGVSSAYAEEVAPHWVGPYPKTFHIHTASLHSTGEGIVPVTFVAREGEGESIAATILRCQTDKGEGSVTGPQTLTTTLTLTGCVSHWPEPRATCSNTTKPQEVVAAPSNGELGLINASSNSVGLRFEFNLEAICKSPKSTYNVRIRGSAIGEIRPINTLSNVFTVAFKRSGWEQEPSTFEGGVPASLESEVGTSGPQPTAVDTTEFLKFAKVTEIRRGH